MHATYGNYVIANTFNDTDHASDLPENEAPIFSAAFEDDPEAKRHAACDECRKRKLKCSGEPTGCARCIKQRLTCHYSKQAQMGRPRKKRKTSEEADTKDDVERRPSLVTAEQLTEPTPSVAANFVKENNRTEFENLCAGPFTQYVKSRTPAPPPPFLSQGSLYEQENSSSNETPPTESPPTPVISQREASEAAHAKHFTTWPDYSTMTMLPQIVQDNHPPRSTHSVDSVHGLSAAPSCPCLPNLYLTGMWPSLSNRAPADDWPFELQGPLAFIYICKRPHFGHVQTRVVVTAFIPQPLRRRRRLLMFLLRCPISPVIFEEHANETCSTLINPYFVRPGCSCRRYPFFPTSVTDYIMIEAFLETLCSGGCELLAGRAPTSVLLLCIQKPLK